MESVSWTDRGCLQRTRAGWGIESWVCVCVFAWEMENQYASISGGGRMVKEEEHCRRECRRNRRHT